MGYTKSVRRDLSVITNHRVWPSPDDGWEDDEL